MSFPENSLIQSKKAKLIMFAQPFCPCTKASLIEFTKLKMYFEDEVQASIVFVKEAGLEKNLNESVTWKHANEIDKLIVVLDKDGSLAKLFKTQTSGEVFLFDKRGKKLYQGGVTSSRGHEGDNQGINSLVNILNKKQEDITLLPSFGCALLSEDKSLILPRVASDNYSRIVFMQKLYCNKQHYI